MKHPEFFIVGFQKCGSSSLAAMLNQHPQIVLSKPKETFYLVDKNSRNYNYERSIDNPNSKWSDFYIDISEDKIWVEASVCNFYQETALNYISQQKNSKVIFILRDPVDRLWSTYLYYGKKDLKLPGDLTFSQYIDLIHKKEYNNEGMGYAIEHGMYSKYIDRWIEVLGKERVLIVGLKPLIKDVNMQMTKICNFLKIEKPEIIKLPHKNISKIMRLPFLTRKLYKIFGGRGLGETKWGKIFLNFNKKNNKEKMSNEARQKFKKIYAAEYNYLSEFF